MEEESGWRVMALAKDLSSLSAFQLPMTDVKILPDSSTFSGT